MTRATALHAATQRVAPEIVELRRDVHRHPELGWQELRTTQVVADALRAAGIEPRVRHDGMGLVAEVGSGKRVVGFRADLDALPVREAVDVPWRSTVDGVMHACGHDAHTAIGVGIARVLATVGELPGRVRFIFQPAEEKLPGGAMTLRAERLHEGLEAILAFHVDPSLAPGKIGVRTGGITGASDRLVVRLHGPGGHTSRPHQTVDLVYVAGRLITDLPMLVKRGIDPRETALVVFGRMAGGEAENVIPTTVEIGGTVRLFDLELWREMPALIERAVHDLTAPFGAKAEVDYLRGAPPVVNDARVIDRAVAAARAVRGSDAVSPTHQSLGSEDFAWYLEDVPGALIRLGVAKPGPTVDLHSASFDLDESAIEVGVEVGAACLLSLLDAPLD